MDADQAIKLFGWSGISIETELRKLEENPNLTFREGSRDSKAASGEPTFSNIYAQFDESIRKEAEGMMRHYSVFYCLENTIRNLIERKLEDAFGENWWNEKVPEQVRRNVTQNLEKEKASGVTPRSSNLLDYTNFGELSEIIKFNFATFGDMLRDQRAVEKILGALNTLRAPIAHCKVLAQDEEMRLELTLRDWFRQME